MGRFSKLLVTGTVALVVACGDDVGDGEATTGTGGSSTTAAPETPGEVRIVGQVDVIDLCGVSGATQISFRATRVGCEPGPPAPCTIQVNPYEEIVGAAASCPGSQNAAEMAVVVRSSGRYHIEARALTESGYVGRCFGPGTEEVTRVTKDQVEAGATIPVTSRAGPCPAP